MEPLYLTAFVVSTQPATTYLRELVRERELQQLRISIKIKEKAAVWWNNFSTAHLLSMLAFWKVSFH